MSATYTILDFIQSSTSMHSVKECERTVALRAFAVFEVKLFLEREIKRKRDEFSNFDR